MWSRDPVLNSTMVMLISTHRPVLTNPLCPGTRLSTCANTDVLLQPAAAVADAAAVVDAAVADVTTASAAAAARCCCYWAMAAHADAATAVFHDT